MRAFTDQRRLWRVTLMAGCVVLVALAGVLSIQAPGLPFGTSRVAAVTEGLDEREPVSNRPTVEAAFAAESYRAGATPS